MVSFRPTVLCTCLAAFSGLAAAQATATLYGIVDVPVSHGSGSLTSLTTVGAPGGGGYAGSRIGLRGSEDLGGGLKANFVIEHGFLPDTGGTASPASFWNRQVWVGVSGGFGEVQLGRIYTPTFLVHATYDAFGPQGVAAQQVLLGSLEVAQPANIRANNAANYQTPNTLGGVVVHALVSAGEGGPGAYKGVRVGYNGGGDFAGDLAIGRYDQAALPTGAGPVALGTLKSFTIGARYKWGALTVYGLYDRADSSVLDSHGLQASVSYVVGATELKASLAQSTLRTDAGVDRGTTRRVGIGAVHFLSRRTALYTSLAHLTNKDGAAMAVAGATTAPNQGASGIDIGIRHAF